MPIAPHQLRRFKILKIQAAVSRCLHQGVLSQRRIFWWLELRFSLKSWIWGQPKRQKPGAVWDPWLPAAPSATPRFLQPCYHPKGSPVKLISSSRQRSYLMSMMTDGVCAMAPIMLQTHITQRNVKKASSQPGLGHLPGTTVAFSAGTEVRHEQPLRFCGGAQGFRRRESCSPHLPSVMRACRQQLWIL